MTRNENILLLYNLLLFLIYSNIMLFVNIEPLLLLLVIKKSLHIVYFIN